jgi:hypothetical protein
MYCCQARAPVQFFPRSADGMTIDTSRFTTRVVLFLFRAVLAVWLLTGPWDGQA